MSERNGKRRREEEREEGQPYLMLSASTGLRLSEGKHSIPSKITS